MLVVNQRVHTTDYQKEIIKLQSDDIDAQKRQITQFKKDVSAELSQTVKETVKSGINTYSEAVKSKSTTSPSAVISQETLKTVARQVAAEEELTRNIMVFNLPEEEDEDLSGKVSDVFGQLNEKPRIEVSRIGRKRTGGVVLPVKVSLCSATSVQLILAKAKNLRQSERFKAVFLSPDRTSEQRIQQKELVLEMKRRAAAEPQKRHFIRGGQICCVDIDNDR